MQNKEIKELLAKTAEKGYLLPSEALPLLKNFSEMNLKSIIDFFIEKLQESQSRGVVVKIELVEKILNLLKKENREERKEKGREEIETFLPEGFLQEETAKDWDGKIEVELDPSRYINRGEKITDFIRLFINRYIRLRKIIESKIEGREVEDIEDIQKYSSQERKQVTIVGMVFSKRKSLKGNYILELEDLTGSIKVIVNKNMAEAAHIIPDQVIGVKGRVWKKGVLNAEVIYFPGPPRTKPKTFEREIYMAFISDLHIGSKAFLQKEFQKFLEWLNLKRGNEKEKRIVSKIKYLIIAGDLVDGVGVYPGQENELMERDIGKQYDLFIKYMKKVPNYLDIIFVPGNHDATRLSEPQPSIIHHYIEPLKEERQIYSLGNPSRVVIDGYKVLIYHGKSLEDWNTVLPRRKRNKPEEAIHEMLISRHLSPLYGSNVPLAPESFDFHLIEDPPDIVQTGHLHINGEKRVNGITCIASGTWQRKTIYQAEMNINPTPGIVQLVNMGNQQIFRKRFL